MNLFESVHIHLTELVGLLGQLQNHDYTRPCRTLSNSSIGQHTRHIIELFQCLLSDYESNTISYDKRKRDKRIEENLNFAVESIQQILENIQRENKSLLLLQNIAGIPSQIETNYYREVLYNIEHCIHHQALIKVGILELENIQISENFGVAESTINSRLLTTQNAK